MPPDPKVRQALAIQMRLEGQSYLQIATQLSYAGPSGAHAAVQAGLREFAPETADQLRNLEVARLDALMNAHWTHALEGETSQLRIDHTKIVLEIMKRRAALLGLDAPKRIDLTAYLERIALEHGIPRDQAIQDAARIVQEAGF